MTQTLTADAAPSTVEESTGEVPILEVEDLSVTFYTPRGTVRAVREASLRIRRGEVVGLVGESGCGKSTVAFAVMGYLPGTAETGGRVLFEGQDVGQMSEATLRELRGNRVAMVYQDPATSLNPSMRVGPQLEEVLHEHLDLSATETRERAIALFTDVGLPDPETVGERYPHQLSGGQQQRAVIAMALACDPDLLVMDEPTTGLDVTTEATILDLVVDLKDRVNAGILFVTHNLGVIARVADRVVVMYAGQTVEEASVEALFDNPRHPYTGGLLSCVPRARADGTMARLRNIPGSVYAAEGQTTESCLFAPRCPMAQDRCQTEAPVMVDAGGAQTARCFFWDETTTDIWGEVRPRRDMQTNGDAESVVTVKNLHSYYGGGRRKYVAFGPEVERPVRAVVGVDLDVQAGRTLGIVGESGCGKTTIGRTLVGLLRPSRGELQLRGEPLPGSVRERTAEQRSSLQMVFQNPTASLNPKLPVRHAIVRSLRKLAGLGKDEATERAGQLMEAVGLDATYLGRIPVELSGGEQQRVALASAFAAEPDVIVADEAVSALDVSVQAQVLNLLLERQKEAGTSYVFISHDLGVVRYVSDDIVVLYAGHVAESGPAQSVFETPSHPYTEALISAAPVPDPSSQPSRIRLEGAVPTSRERFKGCSFAGRCPRKIGTICDETPPPLQSGASAGHAIYCHIPIDELEEMQRETRAALEAANGDGYLLAGDLALDGGERRVASSSPAS